MKFSALAAVVAGASLAQVGAIPLRVMIVSSGFQAGPPPAFNGVRYGHGVPPPADIAMIKDAQFAGPMRTPHRPCGGRMRKFREKTIDISNTFRKALGWPLIESHPHHGHNGDGKMVRVLPFIGTPPTFVQIKGSNGQGMWEGKTKGGDRFNILPVDPTMLNPTVPVVHMHHAPHHHVHSHHRKGGRPPFLTRMHHSLMNLGAWEGRAVAFVLGCGIGVLLRMFWVLTIVMYRAIKGRNEDEHQYSHIIIEDLGGELSAPPTYIYPIDEKSVVVEAPKAPESAEHL